MVAEYESMLARLKAISTMPEAQLASLEASRRGRVGVEVRNRASREAS